MPPPYGMKIIDRYILREYLIPLLYCVFGFSLIYVVWDLFDSFGDFLEAHLSVLDVIVFYGHYLVAVNGFVPFIVVVLPISLLLSVLYTLVMFARHNELIAMRACGLSMARLVIPLLGVGLLCSVAALVAQETLGPVSTRYVAEFRKTRLRPKADKRTMVNNYIYHSGTTRRHWMIGSIDTKKPTVLNGVKVTQDRQDGSLSADYSAERAEWLDGRWWFYRLKIQRYNERGDPLGRPSVTDLRPVEMVEFTETPDDFLTEMRPPDYLSSWDMWTYLKQHPNVSEGTKARRLTDLHARLAMPWSCVVMVLLGLPAGAATGRRGAVMNVMLGIFLLFAFYFLVNAGMILGKRELLWPWLAAWVPNLACAGVGLAMLSRIR